MAGARQYLAPAGVYALAAVSAVVGADAPTLSLARLASDGVLASEVGVRAIVVVAIATTLSKAGIVVFIGRGRFSRRVGSILVATALAGSAALYAL